MSQETAVWLTRIGIVFEFLGFCFGLWQLLGKDQLEKMERELDSRLRRTRELVGSWRDHYLSVVFIVFLVVMFIGGGVFWKNRLETQFKSLFTETVLGGLLYVLVLLALLAFLPVLMTTLIAVLVSYSSDLFGRFLGFMAAEESLRYLSFLLGAILFVSGTVLQFLGTF